MEGKKTRGRPRQMMLNWMMADDYGKVKEEAQQREQWQHHTLEPSYETEKHNKIGLQSSAFKKTTLFLKRKILPLQLDLMAK